MKSSTPTEHSESSNIFRQARLRAAQNNPELSTLEKASEILCINREKLGQIEQEDPEKRWPFPTQTMWPEWLRNTMPRSCGTTTAPISAVWEKTSRNWSTKTWTGSPCG